MPAEARPRVLVVDDDEDTRQLIGFALGANRFEVVEVANGEPALSPSPLPRAWILGDLRSDDVVRDLPTMCGIAPREGSSACNGGGPRPSNSRWLRLGAPRG